MTNEQFNILKESSFEVKKEKIANLGIYELRGVARALGVSSPTTKKRDFLVDAILEKLGNNQGSEQAQATTKGRPFKKLESVDSILSLLSDNDLKEPIVEGVCTYEDIISFAQEIPVFEYHSNDNLKMSGILRITKKSAYFIEMENGCVVFVPAEFLTKYDLQNGDFIKAKTYQINKNNQYSVKEIEFINNKNAEDYFVENPPMRVKVLPKRCLNINGKKFILGGRNLFITEDPLFLENEITNVMNEISFSGEKTVFIGLNLCQEDKLLLDDYKGFLKFYTEYGKSETAKEFDKIIDAINYCERLTRANESVILIINDVMSVLNSLDKYFSENGGIEIAGHYQQSTVVIQKLMSLACSYSNGFDCSTLLICNQLDLDNEFLKSEIIKLSRKIK